MGNLLNGALLRRVDKIAFPTGLVNSVVFCFRCVDNVLITGELIH